MRFILGIDICYTLWARDFVKTSIDYENRPKIERYFWGDKHVLEEKIRAEEEMRLAIQDLIPRRR